jgi:membrane-bound serine protease (ClpP class)
MHPGLAFLAGALVVTGAVLIISAGLGIAYLGLALQVEVVIAIILLVVAGIIAWLFYEGVRAQYKRVKTGKEALIGAKGVVTTALEPKGEIRVSGEFWQATTKDGAIPVGVDVEVVSMEGMFLVVKPAEQKA